MIKAVATEVGMVLVIGAANSSNAHRLREVAEAVGTRAYLINDIREIGAKWSDGVSRVEITAGVSTPECLVHEAVQVLRWTGAAEVREVEVVNESVRFGRPPELEEIARQTAGVHRDATVGHGNPAAAGTISQRRSQ